MNIQRRIVNQQPPLTVDYTILSVDELGIVTAEPVRIIYGDFSVLTTIPGDPEYPNAIYDPDSVQEEYDNLVQRDRLYLDVCRELLTFMPEDTILYRLDIDGQVIIGIPTTYSSYSDQIFTSLLDKFKDQIEWYELSVVWADVNEVEEEWHDL